jgi:hypothetical protein
MDERLGVQEMCQYVEKRHLLDDRNFIHAVCTRRPDFNEKMKKLAFT